MKNILGILVLGLLWCNVGFAELISITDIKIGDKVTEHFTSKQIFEYYQDDMERTVKGEQVWGKNLKYSALAFIAEGVVKEDYDVVQIYYENKTDKIVSIQTIDVTSGLTDCTNIRDKYVSIYKKNNRITSLFSKQQDKHKFPDGMIDDFINFQGRNKIISFSCYIYQDGNIDYRFQIYENNYNDWVFEKFNN